MAFLPEWQLVVNEARPAEALVFGGAGTGWDGAK